MFSTNGRTGQVFRRPLVNELRELVFDAIQAHIDWDSELLVRGQFCGSEGNKPFKRRSINFERACDPALACDHHRSNSRLPTPPLLTRPSPSKDLSSSTTTRAGGFNTQTNREATTSANTSINLDYGGSPW